MTGPEAPEAASASSPSGAESIWCSSQLLVEGRDDLHLIRALIKARSLPHVQVRPYNGADNFRRFLAGLVATPGFEALRSLGVLRDADQDAAAAFESIQDALRANGIEPPPKPGALEHREADGRTLRVGILVLPEAGTGMLETVLCRTFADQSIAACIDEFMACAADAGELHRESDKARAYAYLATRRRPGDDIGVAARQGFWNLDHAALNPIADFVRSVGARPRRPALVSSRPR